MRCPYDKLVCANNAQDKGASAVGECVYCERDRLKVELEIAQNIAVESAKVAGDTVMKAALWDCLEEQSQPWWAQDKGVSVTNLIEQVKMARRKK